MSIIPLDPEFLNDHDEWMQEATERRNAALAQMVEQRTCNAQVEGSNPSSSTMNIRSRSSAGSEREPSKLEVVGSIPTEITIASAPPALLAQRSEQDAHNVLVGGSNPSEGTIHLTL